MSHARGLNSEHEDFKKSHGREPKLWIDKHCIDQNNITESLACLPAFLSGCQKLLVLCGSTYLDRLWCLIEIMVFVEMGGDLNNLEIKLFPDLVETEAVSNLDARNARCFTEYDTVRLQAVLEVTGHDCIAATVKKVLGERRLRV